MARSQTDMPRVVRVMRHPGLWEELPECQQCMGQGACLVEQAVPDCRSGSGYLVERLGECPTCNGNGYAEWPEDDDDD